jgi:AcrR family transcriptional regulator
VTEARAPRWSRLEYDERREQILSTARALFAERPYGEVSTIEIADAAGVTRGLLHHYFGTKRSLYLEVVRELVGSPVLDVLEAITTAPEQPPRSWEDSVALWMDVIEANQDAWLIAIDAGETGRDRAMQEILDGARERTVTEVIRVLGIDEADLPEIRAVVRCFGSLAEEITREWLQRKRLTKEQARVILVGTLPGMVESLVPRAGRAPGAGRPRRVRKTT